MSDPTRLLYGARGSLVAELLTAGADEMPSEVAVQRALKRATLAASAAATLTHSTASHAAGSPAALKGAGALGGAAQGAGVSAGAAKVGVSVAALAKWAGIAAVGIGVSSAAPSVVRWLEPTLERPHAAAQSEAKGQAQDSNPLELSPAPVAAKPPEGVEPTGALGRVEASARNQPRARPTARTPKRSALDELRLVDTAREALQAGDAARALETLEPYETRVIERQFELEVGVLRMEALARLGRTEAARHQARLLLTRSPSERQAARARAIVEQESFE